MRVKVSSCVRSSLLRERLTSETTLLPINEAPQEGDLIVVRVLTQKGAYTEVEDLNGRYVRLYVGDTFVGVLGTRKSGTNLTATIPAGPLAKGDVLHVVAFGGLIAEAVFVPRYYGSIALEVEVQGFLPWNECRPANLRDVQHIDESPVRSIEEARTIFVAGTSAEAGKTTTVCQTLRSIRRLWPDLKVGAIKGAGTGRLEDVLQYVEASAAHATDFVDAGWPSTYNIPPNDYIHMLESLIRSSLQHVELVIVEIGGDLLEARAPEALSIAFKWHAPVFLVANDAMGAMTGLDLLKNHGIHNVTIVTMKQNQNALAERLQLPFVLDPLDEQQVDQVLIQLLPTELIGKGAA